MIVDGNIRDGTGRSASIAYVHCRRLSIIVYDDEGEDHIRVEKPGGGSPEIVVRERYWFGQGGPHHQRQ